MTFFSARTCQVLIGGVIVISLVGAVVAICWPRSDALSVALQPLLNEQAGDQSLVASAILENYNETRSNAARWSGVYWGFTFLAATLSALAGLILKVESILKDRQEMKKDIAALLAVVSALLITISTSGDFQRKWQANRVAASELERTGYAFLEKKTADPRKYFADIGNILHKRNLAIVGNIDQRQSETETKQGGNGG